MTTWAAIAATPPKAVLPKAVLPKDYAPTICIPRLPSTFSDGQIVDIINDIGLGKIKKIDLISKIDRNGVDYLIAFVHMEEWLGTETAQSVLEDLLNDEKITVVYDDPLFLTLTKSRTPRPHPPRWQWELSSRIEKVDG